MIIFCKKTVSCVLFLFTLCNISRIAAMESLAYAATLHEAVAKGSWQDAHAHIKRDPRSVFERNTNGGTPLHVAANLGYDEICNLLLLNGAQINTKNNFGNTPLHLAVLNSHESTCRLLKKNGADASVVNNQGASPLQLAQQQQNQRLVELFAKDSSQQVAKILKFVQNVKQVAGLNFAAVEPHTAQQQEQSVPHRERYVLPVIPAKVPYSSADDPLRINHQEFLQKKRKFGVSCNELSLSFKKAGAAQFSSFTSLLPKAFAKIAKLINNGQYGVSFIDVQDVYGTTGLMLSCTANPYMENAETTCFEYCTAAYLEESLKIFHQILTKTFQVNATDMFGNTALMYLLYRRTRGFKFLPTQQDYLAAHLKTAIGLLLSKGADANIMNIHAETPLLFMTEVPLDDGEFNLEIIKMLLESGAHVNQECIFKNRVLLPIAVVCEAWPQQLSFFKETIRLLLKHGADARYILPETYLFLNDEIKTILEESNSKGMLATFGSREEQNRKKAAIAEARRLQALKEEQARQEQEQRQRAEAAAAASRNAAANRANSERTANALQGPAAGVAGGILETLSNLF